MHHPPAGDRSRGHTRAAQQRLGTSTFPGHTDIEMELAKQSALRQHHAHFTARPRRVCLESGIRQFAHVP